MGVPAEYAVSYASFTRAVAYLQISKCLLPTTIRSTDVTATAAAAAMMPICVMARAVLQRVLDPHHLDQLFARTAQRQYTNELLFSSLVVVMTRFVLGQDPSVHTAYRQLQDQLPVSDPSVYNKFQHVELAVSATLVHDSAVRVAPVLRTLRASLPPLLR